MQGPIGPREKEKATAPAISHNTTNVDRRLLWCPGFETEVDIHDGSPWVVNIVVSAMTIGEYIGQEKMPAKHPGPVAFSTVTNVFNSCLAGTTGVTTAHGNIVELNYICRSANRW